AVSFTFTAFWLAGILIAGGSVLTPGGRPASATVTSAVKSFSRVTLIVQSIAAPGATEAASNFSASANGGFSVTARPSCVNVCRGGTARPPIATDTRPRTLASTVTSLPSIFALPWIANETGPVARLSSALTTSVPAGAAGC